jgi:hypothetical protein
LESIMKYDIIGDVHGCFDELCFLLEELGYTDNEAPHLRQLIFVGDLINKGPKSIQVLKMVIKLSDNGIARLALGNHDYELLRILQGKQPCTPKYRQVLREIRRVSTKFERKVLAFLEAQPTFLELENDLLIVHGAYGACSGAHHFNERKTCLAL